MANFGVSVLKTFKFIKKRTLNSSINTIILDIVFIILFFIYQIMY